MDIEKESRKRQPNSWIPKISLFTYNRARIFSLIWVVLTVFGILSYTVLLKREGFPSIDIPFSIASGTYFVNDASKVDAEAAKKVGDIVLEDKRVAKVQTIANASFYTVVVQYNEGTNADVAGDEIEQRVKDAGILPSSATLDFATPEFGFTQRGDDAVISLYSATQVSTEELTAEGKKLADFIVSKNLSAVENVSIIDPFLEGMNPITGEVAKTQVIFDRYGERQGDSNLFYDSVVVGVTQKAGADAIELDEQLRTAVAEYNRAEVNPYQAEVSASYAPQIKAQVNELQRALLEGLLAVLVVGSIIIAVRASLITVLAMLTVLSITLAILWLAGYSLNVITLFSLILCLALIVDDTIIMIEAIDAQRRRRHDPEATVEVATHKISRAMVAATLTAALSFAPLLFISGILGGFIRAIPFTVITSLLVSLTVALVFIPVFAKFLLLRKNQMGAENVHEPAAKIEEKIAHFITKPMIWARGSTKKLLSVGSVAVAVGLTFIVLSVYLFTKVTFNIFPPTKDANEIVVQMSFPSAVTVEQAIELAHKSDAIVAETTGTEFETASYYATGASQQGTLLYVNITPYDERDIRSPEIVANLQKAFDGFEGARVTVYQLDIAPPPTPFEVRVATDDREAGARLAADIQKFLTTTTLIRTSGQEAKVTSAQVADSSVYTRADGDLYIQVSAVYDGDDTSTLVSLTQTAIEKEFPPERLSAQYGLPEDTIRYDSGQEGEFQKSFNSLAYAFPALLVVMYILLAFQFRSALQPLLIYMAIPFSLFGIALGLYLTDNAISFFTLLGFFALLGLSLKNTILLTDYANQQRRAGKGVVDAAVEALGERFRPLIATSFTAVVSLTPLAFLSPFWEGLAVVLIGGLLCSTFLVILVFPYYYLGVEFLRLRIGRKLGLTWFFLTVALAVGLHYAGLSLLWSFLAPVIVAVLIFLVLMLFFRKR